MFWKLIMRAMIKIGDIIEIKTSKGLAYAQYTHEHTTPPRFGSLIRVLPGFYDERPDNFVDIVKQKTVFVVFIALQVAVSKNYVEVVGNQPVPPDAQIFPVFRGGIPDPKTRKVKVWWFWDGEKSWKVGDLTDEQKRMPIRAVIGDELLAKRIASGWTPENDPMT
jgi:hypothetical protein